MSLLQIEVRYPADLFMLCFSGYHYDVQERQARRGG